MMTLRHSKLGSNFSHEAIDTNHPGVMIFSMRTLLLGLCSCFFAPTTAVAGVPTFGQELPDLVEKIRPGVVNVSSTMVEGRSGPTGIEDFLRFWGIPQERKHTSLGSGFVIDEDGFVITNHHVIDGADEVTISFLDQRQLTARIVGRDPKLDLALLQVRDKSGKVPSGLKPAALGDSEKVRIAEPVVAIGNPFGLQHTVTMGIISAKNRTIGVGPLDNFIQTDASINPGNSGGPLFNLKGEVIGINTVIFSRTGQSGGLGFAIPINEAKAILGDLKKYGRVPRPWLGVLTEKVTPQLARYYGLKRESGVVIYNLVQEAPADLAGIKIGDIVFEVGGQKTDDPAELERQLIKRKPGETLSVQIQRGRAIRSLNIKLRELPARVDRQFQGII